MKLYDGIIHETEAVLAGMTPSVYPWDSARAWRDRGEGEFIMKRDAAFELGGRGLPSVNLTVVTTSGIVTADEVLLYGRDLGAITGDSPFARLVILETEDLHEDDDSEKAFQAIRNLEFVRYHVFPEGYMARVSSRSNEEQVRIDRSALGRGMSFERIGFTYINRYREVEGVKHVRVIFVTDAGCVEKLLPFAERTDGITKTLTHILDGMPTDCGHCSMKAVCDEVEGMKELHLQKRKG